MAAVLAPSESAATPDFLTPLDMTVLGSGRRTTLVDDPLEAVSDGDDEQVMQHLREARERLHSIDEDPMCAVDDALDPSLCLRPPHVPRERAQSNPAPRQTWLTQDLRRHSGMPGSHRSLTLDLKDIPFNAYIDAERRRLDKGVGTPGGRTAPSASGPPSCDLSGSCFGLAPYTNLEREEWLWTIDGPTPSAKESEEDGAYSPTAHEASQHAQEAWTWAMSGPPTEQLNGT
ncbi:hypothetical protein MEQU1_003674 [Malassezia equina]|uniref:Uncharacterized protein n=1 Tax=Malassezia equina TaxID=1381935 RepID=A0AAF0J0P5_9BASI|nr:hypothetical protein MEQU1_003674 [Malassezia equina]